MSNEILDEKRKYEVGWVFRVEITSSTIVYTDEMIERLKKLIESDVEIERYRIDELFETLEIHKNDYKSEKRSMMPE